MAIYFLICTAVNIAQLRFNPVDVPGLIVDLEMIIIPFSIAAIILVGGIYAVQRKKWGWALAGSISAILAFFPLGIPAIILVAKSKGEFE